MYCVWTPLPDLAGLSITLFILGIFDSRAQKSPSES